MKATIRTIFAASIICYFSLQTAQAANNTKERVNHKTTRSTVKAGAAKNNEEAHWLKGATRDNFIMPVNPMQKPVKAPLV